MLHRLTAELIYPIDVRCQKAEGKRDRPVAGNLFQASSKPAAIKITPARRKDHFPNGVRPKLPMIVAATTMIPKALMVRNEAVSIDLIPSGA